MGNKRAVRVQGGSDEEPEPEGEDTPEDSV